MRHLAARFSGLVVAALAFCEPASMAAGPVPVTAWPGSELFTNGALEQLSIEIAITNLATLREDPRAFVRAVLKEPGAVYADVAIHLKGSVGSFRPLDDKPGLTLDFDRFNKGRRYHGLRRIHLNNSVEDPSYANEKIGYDMFHAAEIPAPRAGHAIVTLNGRRLGLYVLKEGFTEDFLACYFTQVGGNLFEPGEGHDVNQRLHRNSVQTTEHETNTLEALANAALEPDLARRWQRLGQALDLEEFIRFMAVEVMLCHRDGYSLARNNFRVYENLDTGKFVFFPHGMDQLFGRPDLPWRPHMAGLVAKAVLDTPQGNQLYRESFARFLTNLFNVDRLSRISNQLPGQLQPWLSATELAGVRTAVAELNARMAQRRRLLTVQMSQPEPELLQFTNGSGNLNGWVQAEEPGKGCMDLGRSAGGPSALHISVLADSAASWRTKALLGTGLYRFQGRVRTSGVKALSYGRRQGAALRIGSGASASASLTGDCEWRELATEFEVKTGPADVECICELRARTGEAWFDTSSLRIIRLSK